MKERPILFSGPMVRAILEGKKTQTRRVIKNVRRDNCLDSKKLKFRTHVVDAVPWCPHGRVGDQLWVRETHYYDIPLVDIKQKPDNFDPRDLYFRADGECCQQIPECQCWDVGKPKWRPSIFMPRWASRIQLEITNVRVERLQDISEEDAVAEGVHVGDENMTTVNWFSIAWDAINAKSHPWESNPWCWVVEFKRVER